MTKKAVRATSKKMIALTAFFKDPKAKDGEGRTFEEILKWDDQQLERCHNYIQWLFPLPTPSNFYPKAPILTEKILQEIKEDPKVMANIDRAFARMLKFYGLLLEEGVVKEASNWYERNRVWLFRFNHNHLRITRILTFMSLVGKNSQASGFLNFLEKLYLDMGPELIAEETLGYWRKAVTQSASSASR